MQISDLLENALKDYPDVKFIKDPACSRVVETEHTRIPFLCSKDKS
jgi:hypothetical protein